MRFKRKLLCESAASRAQGYADAVNAVKSALNSNDNKGDSGNGGNGGNGKGNGSGGNNSTIIVFNNADGSSTVITADGETIQVPQGVVVIENADGTKSVEIYTGGVVRDSKGRPVKGVNVKTPEGFKDSGYTIDNSTVEFGKPFNPLVDSSPSDKLKAMALSDPFGRWLKDNLIPATRYDEERPSRMHADAQGSQIMEVNARPAIVFCFDVSGSMNNAYSESAGIIFDVFTECDVFKNYHLYTYLYDDNNEFSIDRLKDNDGVDPYNANDFYNSVFNFRPGGGNNSIAPLTAFEALNHMDNIVKKDTLFIYFSDYQYFNTIDNFYDSIDMALVDTYKEFADSGRIFYYIYNSTLPVLEEQVVDTDLDYSLVMDNRYGYTK